MYFWDEIGTYLKSQPENLTEPEQKTCSKVDFDFDGFIKSINEIKLITKDENKFKKA